MSFCFLEIEGDFIEFVTLGSLIAALAAASTKSLPRIPVWDGIHVDTLCERLGGVRVCEGVQGR